jgi:hypothetical protein
VSRLHVNSSHLYPWIFPFKTGFVVLSPLRMHSSAEGRANFTSKLRYIETFEVKDVK